MAGDGSSQRPLACRLVQLWCWARWSPSSSWIGVGGRTLLIAGGIQMCLAEVSGALAGNAFMPPSLSCSREWHLLYDCAVECGMFWGSV